MPALPRIALGAPGVYTLPPEPIRRLTGVRLDACAFVGVAPRGPCRVPVVDATAAHSDDWRMCDPMRPRLRTVAVPVDSFDAYRRQFGGFEGPGLLPYAVASFFEQGGREAWVLRIVHDHGSAVLDAGGVASAVIGGVVGSPLLRARNEGSWGDALRVQLGFQTRALLATPLPPSTASLRLGGGQRLDAGALLRLRLADGSHVLRFVARVERVGDTTRPTRWLRAVLEAATPAAIEAAELVEATLAVQDGQSSTENHAGLGLHVDHPRWLATVLCRESELLWPDFAWAGDRLLPAAVLRLSQVHAATPFSGGEDRWATLAHADFFDAAWDALADTPAAGLQAVVGVDAITQIVLPDLYQAQPLPPQAEVRDVSLAGAAFAPCVELPAAPPTPANTTELPGLALDPTDPVGLARIVELLQRVQTFVETTRDHIALLDMPPRLKPQQLLALRAQFDSAWCALYHPWLAVARADDTRDALVALPPSAAAAGIVAATELALGVPHGPANRIVQGALKPLQVVDPAEHARLHPQGVNVFVQDSTGVRLTAARTLSLDPAWRQLSVRRLVLMLRRTLLRQMQWAAFEPHTAALRRQLVHLCTALLRRLYRLGAFSGASEEQAFFVRCDDTLNPPNAVDNGRLLAHIGIAPAEPLEFIVLQFARSGDGTLTLEAA
ncbi:MAG: phage tail sheath subtilisin-like domain-containing protein [Rubrivivax sp.]|nr:phage tail sheath subtilisin-like domain-containing protein [Rubrivivax sp.]